jgi:phage terminase large subunit
MPFAHTFKPIPWQLKPWRSQSRTLLLHGGAGSGKSLLCAEKMHALMQRYPNSTGLVVRKFFSSLRNSVIPLLNETVIGPGAHHAITDHRFEYQNGSWLCYAGVSDEKQREALKSIGKGDGVDFLWIEEANALSFEDYQVLMTRLRGKSAGWRQAMLSCNPDHENHWINRKLIEAKQEAIESQWISPYDNPHLDRDYLSNLEALTGVPRDRLLLGKWISAEGMVWPYEPGLHLCDPMPIPDHWRRIKVVDFGWLTTAILWQALDPDSGDIHVYRQLYQGQQLVSDIGATVKVYEQLHDKGRFRYEAAVCDHDAEGRAQLERAWGCTTTPAHKAIREGVQAVTERFANRKQRRIWIHRGSLIHPPDSVLRKAGRPTELVDELLGYRFDDKKDGYPVKENDHACDALRYGVCYWDGVSKDGAKLANSLALMSASL